MLIYVYTGIESHYLSVAVIHKMTFIAYHYLSVAISLATVPLKCNFTHAWLSTHGYMQIFTCKVQKMSVKIFNFTRRGVSRDVAWNSTRREVPRDILCTYTATSLHRAHAYKPLVIITNIKQTTRHSCRGSCVKQEPNKHISRF